ncbi:uncharacterized protein CCOS01_00047 [Colletotrichum costaricense]|uniref:Uncharacterized protein n=1 Tax=Colletotrichum costaricense TaxID=1209916 RepID=A0AAI9Z8Q6_9PEZI|nr:uncharacterized protein CCOS01_00047 [Colletotrichum costaricense]KAK1538733.1 hypothetical protein CCOS01_00047 [Colletotrichum costaricense]
MDVGCSGTAVQPIQLLAWFLGLLGDSVLILIIHSFPVICNFLAFLAFITLVISIILMTIIALIVILVAFLTSHLSNIH